MRRSHVHFFEGCQKCDIDIKQSVTCLNNFPNTVGEPKDVGLYCLKKKF